MSRTSHSIGYVITSYNYGHYLPQAIDSIDRQTVKPDQIIIVDDGSTDPATVNLINQLKETRKDLEIYVTENQGVGAARNFGVKRLDCELVCCLDSDDILQADYIEKCLDRFKTTHLLGFVTTWMKMFQEKDDIWQIKKSDIIDFCIQNNAHAHSMFRKTAWEKAGGYLEGGINGYDDWNLWLSILACGYEYDVIEEPLFLHRVHGTSQIHTSDLQRADFYRRIIDHNKKLFEARHSEIIIRFQEILTGAIASNEKFVESRLNYIKLLEEKISRLHADYELSIKEKLDYIKQLEQLADDCKSAFKNTERLVDERDRYILELEAKLNQKA